MIVVNISGITLNTALETLKRNSINLIKLKWAFRNKYSVLEALIISKASMVSNARFYQIQ